jgi:hypothetical protein
MKVGKEKEKANDPNFVFLIPKKKKDLFNINSIQLFILTLSF